jgi:hypothetical protein
MFSHSFKMENLMKNTYFLLSLALLASGTALAMHNGSSSIEATVVMTALTCGYNGYCTYATINTDLMKCHSKRHKGEKPAFKCNVCKTFATGYKQLLDKHIQRYHPACINYPTCQYRALNNKQLAEHVQEHQQQLNNARLANLMAHNIFAESPFTIDKLIANNRK